MRNRIGVLAGGLAIAVLVSTTSAPLRAQATKYVGRNGAVRVALVKQPLLPNGPSKGPTTMAEGGIQRILADLGATVRVDEARLTALQETEYGGWKKLGFSLGQFADIVARNERDGYFTVGLLATCPSMPGLVAGLQRSGSTVEALRIGMLWLDAHADLNTPETTRSGSLGGMPVAVATGRALHVMRLDAKLDPPLSDRHVVMGGVRLTDPLEQHLLDTSMIEQLSVDDLRQRTPAVWAQLNRLDRISDKIYVHIDMDVLDPRSDGPRQQGAQRPVERTAVSQSLGDRLCDDPAHRRGRTVDRGPEPDDSRRRPRRESTAVGPVRSIRRASTTDDDRARYFFLAVTRTLSACSASPTFRYDTVTWSPTPTAAVKAMPPVLAEAVPAPTATTVVSRVTVNDWVKLAPPPLLPETVNIVPVTDATVPLVVIARSSAVDPPLAPALPTFRMVAARIFPPISW
jgi:hypothetical protein